MAETATHPFLVVYRLYADDAGETHFTRTLVPRDVRPETIARRAHSAREAPQSIRIRSAGVIVSSLPAGFHAKVSVVTERRFIVVMSGRMEISASDGTKRTMGPGDAFIAMDEGVGLAHETRVIDGPVVMTIAVLDRDMDLSDWIDIDEAGPPVAGAGRP